jgi:hypothetical protein
LATKRKQTNCVVCASSAIDRATIDARTIVGAYANVIGVRVAIDANDDYVDVSYCNDCDNIIVTRRQRVRVDVTRERRYDVARTTSRDRDAKTLRDDYDDDELNDRDDWYWNYYVGARYLTTNAQRARWRERSA